MKALTVKDHEAEQVRKMLFTNGEYTPGNYDDLVCEILEKHPGPQKREDIIYYFVMALGVKKDSLAESHVDEALDRLESKGKITHVRPRFWAIKL